jgi:hypothetical protein
MKQDRKNYIFNRSQAKKKALHKEISLLQNERMLSLRKKRVNLIYEHVENSKVNNLIFECIFLR